MLSSVDDKTDNKQQMTKLVIMLSSVDEKTSNNKSSSVDDKTVNNATFSR